MAVTRWDSVRKEYVQVGGKEYLSAKEWFYEQKGKSFTTSLKIIRGLEEPIEGMDKYDYCSTFLSTGRQAQHSVFCASYAVFVKFLWAQNTMSCLYRRDPVETSHQEESGQLLMF